MKLFLFTTELNLAKKAESAGIDSVIVDWETRGKRERQAGVDLEINVDTPEDVARLAAELRIPVTVRINSLGDWTAEEVDCALNHGAKILILPMAKTNGEVKQFLGIVNGRARTIIQVETLGLVSHLKEMKELNWDYAYIGLNDLMLSRGGSSIWDAVLDGTVEKTFNELRGREYGFCGVTVVGGGDPIPFELLLHEMVRLKCSVSVLRRSFKKEILDRDLACEVQTIRSFIASSLKRGPLARKYDHERLKTVLKREIENKQMQQSLNV